MQIGLSPKKVVELFLSSVPADEAEILNRIGAGIDRHMNGRQDIYFSEVTEQLNCHGKAFVNELSRWIGKNSRG